MWQYPADAQQGANFLALLAVVRLYLPEEHYLLTTALPASRSILANIDLHRAAEYLDLQGVDRRFTRELVEAATRVNYGQVYAVSMLRSESLLTYMRRMWTTSTRWRACAP